MQDAAQKETEFARLTPYLTCQTLSSSISAGNKDMMSRKRKMGVQLSRTDRVENIVGKGEIARYEQFLLFPQCFLKLSVF